jgi:hypothetical protein
MPAGARELEPEEQIRALITRYFMALDRRGRSGDPSSSVMFAM